MLRIVCNVGVLGAASGRLDDPSRPHLVTALATASGRPVDEVSWEAVKLGRAARAARLGYALFPPSDPIPIPAPALGLFSPFVTGEREDDRADKTPLSVEDIAGLTRSFNGGVPAAAVGPGARLGRQDGVMGFGGTLPACILMEEAVALPLSRLLHPHEALPGDALRSRTSDAWRFSSKAVEGMVERVEEEEEEEEEEDMELAEEEAAVVSDAALDGLGQLSTVLQSLTVLDTHAQQKGFTKNIRTLSKFPRKSANKKAGDAKKVREEAAEGMQEEEEEEEVGAQQQPEMEDGNAEGVMPGEEEAEEDSNPLAARRGVVTVNIPLQSLTFPMGSSVSLHALNALLSPASVGSHGAVLHHLAPHAAAKALLAHGVVVQYYVS